MNTKDLPAGAFDLHVHAAPDVVPRRQDLAELARDAKAAGMAGICIKDHTLPTAGRAHAINRLQEGGAAFYGCLALNAPVGGLNPTAVEAFLREGGKMVYLPTYCAANHIRIWGRGKPPTPFPMPETLPGIELLDDSGKLVPAVHEIIALVKEHDAVLGTGHVSPEEGLAALQAAAAAGVKRLVATHVSEPVTSYSREQQERAVALGAVLEHCYFAVTPSCPGDMRLEDILAQIEQAGPENVVLSSDMGQPDNPDPVIGLSLFVEGLLKLGAKKEALRIMTVENPGRLLLG